MVGLNRCVRDPVKAWRDNIPLCSGQGVSDEEPLPPIQSIHVTLVMYTKVGFSIHDTRIM